MVYILVVNKKPIKIHKWSSKGGFLRGKKKWGGKGKVFLLYMGSVYMGFFFGLFLYSGGNMRRFWVGRKRKGVE